MNIGLALAILILGVSLGSMLTMIHQQGLRRRFEKEIKDALEQALFGNLHGSRKAAMQMPEGTHEPYQA